MSEKNKPKNFVEAAFTAESNSAANLAEKDLNKYSSIAVKMFHTPVLTPKEMIYPGVGQFATQLLKALEQYRTLLGQGETLYSFHSSSLFP